jgi:hypothetical protein
LNIKLVLLVLLCISTPLFAVDQSITLERLHYEKDVSEIKTIKIINKFGDIRIRKSDQDNFIFHGVSQFSKTYQAELITKLSDNQLLITVEYPKLPASDSLERVDVALIVPSYIELDIEIEKGDLSIKKVKNSIKARSKNSNFTIKSSNAIDLYSHNGDINLTLVNHKTPQSIKLQTQKGDVDLNYHKDQTPSVQIISGGSTTSNSVTMLQNKKKNKRVTSYKDSKSFDRVEIQSDTGSIQLIEIEQL